MSILVYTDHINGNIKKATYESLAFAKKISNGNEIIAVAVGNVDQSELADLGMYGATKVALVNQEGTHHFDSQVYAAAISKIADQIGVGKIIFAHSSSGKAIAPRVSVRWNAGLASGIIAINEDGTFKKGVFSGKAFANVNVSTDKQVISIMPNTFPAEKRDGSAAVEVLQVDLPSSKITVKEVKTSTGTVPLPEAEKVVSGGRGLKGPENWGMVEELADLLGATLACSRPVADIGWRPHHEHVGQTGIAIRPNLYIAIGISGAIQHLAGVNNSKTIVVINTDAEAPFFKAADYGVVGDAFEVVPKLIESLKKYKAANN